jgi:hypothetical protein
MMHEPPLSLGLPESLVSAVAPMSERSVVYLFASALCVLLAVRLLSRALAPIGALVGARASAALALLALGVALALLAVAFVGSN